LSASTDTLRTNRAGSINFSQPYYVEVDSLAEHKK
jgi:hypothetical protein